MQARLEGFDLHAGVRIGARQRDRLEKLSRYHGVLAPAAHGREEIVPQPTEEAACRKPPLGGWAAPDEEGSAGLDTFRTPDPRT